MCQDLRDLMLEREFELLEDGQESGFDDWGVVVCRWFVFSRKKRDDRKS